MPTVGIIPIVESLAAQGLLVVLAVAALVWTFVVAPRRRVAAQPDTPARTSLPQGLSSRSHSAPVNGARATAYICRLISGPRESGRGAIVFGDVGGIASFSRQIETLRVFEHNVVLSQALEGEGHGRVLVVDGGGSVRAPALAGGSNCRTRARP